MKRILAISDIHGELELFNELLEKVNYTPDQDQLILLGDYIDRGPDSKGVLARVMELKEEGAIVLRGNHDEMMVNTVDGRLGAKERWERNKGLATLQGYDPKLNIMANPRTKEFTTHVNFIRGLDYYYETDEYIFVHAGVEPDVPMEKADKYKLVWIREKFYENYKGEKTVVFGHTPTYRLWGERKLDVYFGENNIIGIDGGAVYGGQLNCLELPSKKVYFTRKNPH